MQTFAHTVMFAILQVSILQELQNIMNKVSMTQFQSFFLGDA